MTSTAIRFSSAREKATYEAGMAEVKRKLAACHVPTASERSEASVREGNRQIDRKFGSAVALQRFNIASKTVVPSPAEKLDQIAEAAAARALRKFETGSKPAPAKRPAAPAKAPTSKAPARAASTTKSFSSGYSIKQFSAPSFAR